MSAKRVIFVRHAAVTVETAVPAYQWSLSASGRTRAALFAHRLAACQPTRILTSQEQKAAETGRILGETLHLPYTAVSGLQEHMRHQESFTSRESFQAAITRLLRQPAQLVYGSETGQAARLRLETAVTHQLATYPHDTLVIVSHGTILALLICHHNPHLDPVTFWQQLTMPAALVVTASSWQLEEILLDDGKRP